MFNASDIVEFAKYFTIVHHIEGRLRLKVSPSILGSDHKVSLSDIEALSQTTNGLKSVRVNAMALSVVIEYDSSIIDMQVWEDLVQGKDAQKTQEFFKNLQRKES